MDKNRKKELREQFNQMQTEMGVFSFKCKETGKSYIAADMNIPSTVNSILFQLKNGSFIPNRNLQKDWKAYGKEGFEIKTLETLKYDDDPTKTDYTKEMEILKMIWREKLTETGEVEDINKKYNVK